MANTVVLIVGILFPLIGIGLLAAGVLAVIRQRRRFAGALSATGVVLDLQREVVNPGRPGIYCPLVRFTTTSGQVVEFLSDYGSQPAMHKVGQSVAVRYDPQAPEKAEIDSPLARWLVPGIMLVMGLGFIVLGCMLTAVFFLLGAYAA